jgi:energy-coupling factor transporter ATP-binding protein EcfA2
MTDRVLDFDRLSKRYGDVTALQDLSFQVQAGELFDFVGSNGAGKTTTISMCTGLLRPTAGSVRIAGHDVVKESRQVKPRNTVICPITVQVRTGPTGDHGPWWAVVFEQRGLRYRVGGETPAWWPAMHTDADSLPSYLPRAGSGVAGARLSAEKGWR